jgi:subtilisin-like proprotein convertase family protein
MPSNSDYLNALNANDNVGSSNAAPTGYSLIYSSWGDDLFASYYAGQGIYGAVYYNSTTNQFIFAFNGPNTISAASGLNFLEANPTLANAGAAIDRRIMNGDSTVTDDMTTAALGFYANAFNRATELGLSMSQYNTFVTGMSEGGFIAQILGWKKEIGGLTVGAPGVPGLTASDTPSNANFLNYGFSLDAIAQYATDGAIKPPTPAYHYGSAVQIGTQNQSNLLLTYYDFVRSPSADSALAGVAAIGAYAGYYHNLGLAAQIGFGVDLKLPQTASSISITNTYDILDLEHSLASAIGFSRLSSPIVGISTQWDNNNVPAVTITYADGTTSSINAEQLTSGQYLILYDLKLQGQQQKTDGRIEGDPGTGATTVAAVSESGTFAEIQTFANDGSGRSQNISIAVNSDGETTISGSGEFLVDYVAAHQGQQADHSGWIQVASNDPTFALSNGQEVTVAATSGQTLSAGGNAPGILIDSVGGNDVSIAAGQSATVVASKDQIDVAAGSILNLAGNGNNISTTNSSGSILNIFGTGEIVASNGNSVNFGGSSSATVNGVSNLLTVAGIPEFSLSTSGPTQVDVDTNVIRVAPANGSLGTNYYFNSNGQITSTGVGFIGFSTSGGFSSDSARANALASSVSANIPVYTPTGPISNQWLTGVSVVNLGSVPLGQLPFVSDPSGVVAGGLLVAGPDIEVVFPNANENGVANSSPSSIVTGGYRPGAQSPVARSQSLRSSDYGARIVSITVDGVKYDLTGNDASSQSGSWQNTDPLVLDLSGAGVATTSWLDDPVYFNTSVVYGTPQVSTPITADGQLHATSWVAPGTGILALDLNGNGKIDNITETFSQDFNGGVFNGTNWWGRASGYRYANGLAALASLSTSTTVISAATSKIDSRTGASYWSEIVVWQDDNHDGVSDPGELKTLSQLGITSIGLTGAASGAATAGGSIQYTTTYTRSDGSTGQAADVDLSGNSLGDQMIAASGGVIVRSTPAPTYNLTYVHSDFVGSDLEEVPVFSPSTESFIAGNASAHSYTLSNGQLFDNTTQTVVIQSSATGMFSSDQNDTITVAAGDTGSYWLGGGSGADTLTGGAGNTVFLINSRTIVHGGTGFNIAQVDDANPITIDLASANLQEVVGGAGDGVFNASGTTWNVFIQGGSGNNIIIGGAAHDALSGGTGDDLIKAGDGGSVIHAGSGNDVIYGGSGTTNGAPNSDVIYGGPGNDIVVLGTNNTLVYAGSGTMTVVGNASGFSVLGLHGSYADYTLTHNADGSVTVTNIGNQDGDGAVTMKDVDALDFSDIAQIDVTDAFGMPVVDKLNVGRSSDVTINGSGQYVIAASRLLANDLDYAGKSLTLRELMDKDGNAIARGASGQARGGVVALSEDGSTVTFTPAAGFTGVMSFRYHVQDSDGRNGLPVNQTGTTNMAEMAATVYLNTPSQPSDPLLDDEWFLQAANVLPILNEYTGAGVYVGVFDLSGTVDFSNPDLAVNAGSSKKIDGSPGSDQIGTHATLVAGVIGAAIDGEGTVGVAPGVTISSEAIGPDFAAAPLNFSNLLDWSAYDVVNNSFGITPPFYNLSLSGGAGPTELDALQNAKEYGRQYQDFERGYYGTPLGTIVVVSAGNSRASGGNTNDSVLTNSPYEITVGGINAVSDLSTLQVSGAPFSNAGYSILVSAPANDISSDGVTYTNEYGQRFGASIQTAQGTSFAAPIVSGIVADMLQANPTLNWQDVQEILAYSARKVDPGDTNPFVAGAAAGSGWAFNGAKNWNGGGLHYSPDYGFGEVDALAAVRLAETWQTSPDQNASSGGSGQMSVSGNLASGTFSTTYTASSNLTLGALQVFVEVTNAVRSNLTITLTSPSGVTSTLMARPGSVIGQVADAAQFGPDTANDFTPTTFDYTFETVADWGEKFAGNWTLSVTDASGSASQAVVTAVRFSMEQTNVTNNEVFVYTDEFAQLSGAVGSALYDPNNGARSTLIGSGYSDVINVAATTGTVLLDLNAGSHDSVIDGRGLSIAAGTKLDTVYLGDGTATVIGNGDDNRFYSGRGSDTFVFRGGALGHDIIDGFTSSDTLQFDEALFADWAHLLPAISQSGADTIITIDSANAITLKGVDSSSLGQSSFKFGALPPSQEGPQISIGSGTDALVLQISEDAWQGDAQYTVSVDGNQIGDVLTASSSHADGQFDTVTAFGNWSPGSHAVSLDFLNDAYGGSPSTDRNLYVEGATYDGTSVPGSQLTFLTAGSAGFSVTDTNQTIGSGPDTLALHISEDAWQGDAQYTISVDGNQIGDVLTAWSSHASGTSDTISVLGDWGAGSHVVSVDFLNDAYWFSPDTDRNLYVDSATYNGAPINGAQLGLYVGGPASFSFNAPS